MASLPLDIIEQIISTLWLSPLSTSHRALFIKSSNLVSKRWNSVFARIAARDVYILSASHGSKFLDILDGRSYLQYPLDQLCRSITFEHERNHLIPGPDKDEQLIGKAIHEVLRNIFSHPKRLPFLRRIALEMKNFLLETIFEYQPFSHLPYQVRELDIHFTYGEETNPVHVLAIKSRGYERFGMKHGSMPFVRRLRVIGTSKGVAQELLDACGGRERLLVFEQDAWKEEESIQPVALPSVYEDEDFSDEEDESTDEDSEEFFDCEEEQSRAEECSDDSWSDYEKMLTESFSKDELSRILLALQRQI
ncbi:hypothetical protein Moror_4065 [Moniliophthora roreri MCA 2997]|uniref:Uncharacterized protein n=1 Tax=Moniliophthora roreri (strain MCA 2997) TaxID=1381753 RepID=V2WVB3_MONRO|nr:hypothetical protein Moror_4065 [Moniliophthora roreri MCA 2997]